MSYGASDSDAYRRGGICVGRILKGAQPGHLPIELPTKCELSSISRPPRRPAKEHTFTTISHDVHMPDRFGLLGAAVRANDRD